jgi:hypothetical protein
MTRSQAEQVMISLRAVSWPVVYVEMNDDGTWQDDGLDRNLTACFRAV